MGPLQRLFLEQVYHRSDSVLRPRTAVLVSLLRASHRKHSRRSVELDAQAASRDAMQANVCEVSVRRSERCDVSEARDAVKAFLEKVTPRILLTDRQRAASASLKTSRKEHYG